MAELRRGVTTTSDDVRIAWDRRGSGAPLVLVHGFTDYRSLMEPLAARFARWHDVVNVDVRGHGESSKNRSFSRERLFTDLVEVCEDLRLESPILVGHSIGALIVTGAAARVDALAVVNIDQSLDLNATARRVSTVQERLRDPATFHATLDALFAGESTPGIDGAVQTELDRCAWEIDQDVVLGIWSDILDGERDQIQAEVDTIAGTVTMPYLVYLGSTPPRAYREWLEVHIPTATIDVHEGMGHFLHLAQPDRLVTRVRDFIQ